MSIDYSSDFIIGRMDVGEVRTYAGTPGLFERLFIKRPDHDVFYENYLKTNKSINLYSNAHKRRYLPHAQNANNSGKYKEITSHLFAAKYTSGRGYNNDDDDDHDNDHDGYNGEHTYITANIGSGRLRTLGRSKQTV